MPLNGIRTATETSSMNGNDRKARALKVATSKYTPSQKKTWLWMNGFTHYTYVNAVGVNNQQCIMYLWP